MTSRILAVECVAIALACVACGKPKPQTVPPPDAVPASSTAAMANTTSVLSANPPASAIMDGKLFERDQVPTIGLVAWNDTIVVVADPFFVLDVAGGTSAPLTLPGAAHALGVATFGGNAVALCQRRDGVVVLLERMGAKWSERPVPTGVVYDGRSPLVLAADAKTLVIWEPTRLHRLEGATWSTKPVGASPSKTPGFPKHAVIANERLYLGYDKGEWGGELVSLDLASLGWRVEGTTIDAGSGLDLPVHGLALDPKGHLWVARGLAHLGLREGMLLELDAGQWKLVASSQGALGQRPASSTGDWNLPGTSFDGLAFDSAGRAFVLSGSLGLVRREPSGGYKQLTTGWPEFVYLNGLAFQGDTAVICTYDGGVLLWNMATGGARRVMLAPRPASRPPK